MEVTMELIHEKFDLYRAAFEDLAEQEDKLEEMRNGLEDYKEGSPKHQEAMKEVRAFEKTIAVYQRKFRMAALELDRVKTLVNFMRQ
jgi:soluble cytochrome b562